MTKYLYFKISELKLSILKNKKNKSLDFKMLEQKLRNNQNRGPWLYLNLLFFIFYLVFSKIYIY